MECKAENDLVADQIRFSATTQILNPVCKLTKFHLRYHWDVLPLHSLSSAAVLKAVQEPTSSGG